MSTFDGLIREFPSIAIDNFNKRPGVSVYLLSHVHSDHLTGLASKTWDSPIYCSQITAKWLPLLASKSKQIAYENGQSKTLERRYAHLAPYLRPLSTYQPHYLELQNGRKARCTLIPAHHCPGAIMFLLQDDRSCILYTGDARNEAVDLEALRTMPMFSPGAPPVDRLYLDTTYCHPAFRTFPPRDQTLSDLVNFIMHRPRLAHYYFDAWTFGYEDVWIALSRAFHTKVHVSPYLYELYEAIDDLIEPRILPHLTMDGITARFHSCRLGPSCGYGGAGGEHSSVRELIRIQPNVSWFSGHQQNGESRNEESVEKQGTVFGRNAKYSIREKLPPSIAKRDDLFYYFNYGCHASLSELEGLIRVVAPRALFPCVLHKNTGLQTYADSNSKAVALLAHAMPNKALITNLTEEQRIEARYGITGDFQEYHQVNGYNVLDASDKVRGVKFAIPVSTPRATGQKQSTPILSPRSNHLRKKLDKLKQQLRNSESLEEVQEISDSSVDEGPLSLDLNDLERKRKWWLETERGKSTTFEDDDTELVTESDHRLGISNKGNTFGVDSISQMQDGLGTLEDQCFDKTTLELVDMILPLPLPAQGASKPSSSSDISSGYDTFHFSSLSGDVISLEFSVPQKRPEHIIPKPKGSTRSSESDDVLSSPDPLHAPSHRSRTPPPRISSQRPIILGKSPSSRHAKMTLSELSLIERPAQNIFAQLAWSPPRKPALKRSLMDDSSSRRRREEQPPCTQSCTALVTKDVIVIESSDDEDEKQETEENKNIKRRDEPLLMYGGKVHLACTPSPSPFPSPSTAATATTIFISNEATSVADQACISVLPPPISPTLRGSQDMFWLEEPFTFE
ncbi:MAG: beta-lactamase-like protein [Podila humilis]|nr:MAG: beta-lactamase-like protein [Podila humilis]